MVQKEKLHFKLKSSSGRIHESTRVYEGNFKPSKTVLKQTALGLEWIESYMTEANLSCL